MNAEGRYVYMYHPVEDRDEPSYGWLRHAGTTYALFEAYEELGTPAYLAKGELALKYLEAHLRVDADSQGKYAARHQRRGAAEGRAARGWRCSPSRSTRR